MHIDTLISLYRNHYRSSLNKKKSLKNKRLSIDATMLFKHVLLYPKQKNTNLMLFKFNVNQYCKIKANSIILACIYKYIILIMLPITRKYLGDVFYILTPKNPLNVGCIYTAESSRLEMSVFLLEDIFMSHDA